MSQIFKGFQKAKFQIGNATCLTAMNLGIPLRGEAEILVPTASALSGVRNILSSNSSARLINANIDIGAH
jgi:hypothetical protein